MASSKGGIRILKEDITQINLQNLFSLKNLLKH